MYSIIFSEDALVNIENIRDYISIDSPIIAEKVINSLLCSINYLTVFPELGVKKGKYRELVEPIYKYSIRYRIADNKIYIIVIYKFQNYEV